MEPKTVAVLMSVHNRKNCTLKCLSALFGQTDSITRAGKYRFEVYMTEDGCTDGTADAVSGMFPQVVVIHGDGTLFWNRGMCAAWDEAAKSSPDFYLWLNDDTMLKPGAVASLLENSAYLGHRAIVAGTAEDSNGLLSYGGRTKSGRIINPDPVIPVACSLFNGNLVLVPDYVYRRIGPLDRIYSHSFGDYDYGVRAARHGLTSVVAPGVLAVCDRNDPMPRWRNPEVPLRERYRAIMGPKGRPFKEQLIYDFRAYGPLRAVLHIISLNLKVLLPLKSR